MRRHSIGVTTRRAAAAIVQEEPVQGTDEEPNMLVAVRVRPLSMQEKEKDIRSCCNVLNGKIVAIKKEGDPSGYLRSQMPTINDYGFDAAFDEESTQKEVYEGTAKRFIPNVIKGLNVTVFAYGATGAGKTHTMLGNTRADEASAAAEAGVIPQAVFDLFEQLDAKKAALAAAVGSNSESYSVVVSFVEIYNEQVYDLLEKSGKILQLREDAEKGVVVCAGCTEIVASSAREVMNLLAQGNKNRKTEATMANAVSSRSHAVLQLQIKHLVRNELGREALTESKLSLIDLAGSERASATNNRGARLTEGANINRSLLALANCINALASNSAGGKKTNVKYRDSRLTHLLKSSLEGGNCNLVMIANVNPAHTTFEDSHNTLKYANRAKNIKVNPSATALNVETTWLERETHLIQENAALRERVAELEELVIQLRGDPYSLRSRTSEALAECDEEEEEEEEGLEEEEEEEEEVEEVEVEEVEDTDADLYVSSSDAESAVISVPEQETETDMETQVTEAVGAPTVMEVELHAEVEAIQVELKDSPEFSSPPPSNRAMQANAHVAAAEVEIRKQEQVQVSENEVQALLAVESEVSVAQVPCAIVTEAVPVAAKTSISTNTSHAAPAPASAPAVAERTKGTRAAPTTAPPVLNPFMAVLSSATKPSKKRAAETDIALVSAVAPVSAAAAPVAARAARAVPSALHSKKKQAAGIFAPAPHASINIDAELDSLPPAAASAQNKRRRTMSLASIAAPIATPSMPAPAAAAAAPVPVPAPAAAAPVAIAQLQSEPAAQELESSARLSVSNKQLPAAAAVATHPTRKLTRRRSSSVGREKAPEASQVAATAASTAATTEPEKKKVLLVSQSASALPAVSGESTAKAAAAVPATVDKENSDPQLLETALPSDSKNKPFFKPPASSVLGRRKSLETSLASVSAMMETLSNTALGTKRRGLSQVASGSGSASASAESEAAEVDLQLANVAVRSRPRGLQAQGQGKVDPIEVVQVEGGNDEVWIDI